MPAKTELPEWIQGLSRTDDWFEKLRDLGSGHYYVPYTDSASGGIVEYHESLRSPGEWCGGSIPFMPVPAGRDGVQRPRWTVLCLDPLTLDPSVLCACGVHGWIREGRWQDA